MSPTSYRTAPPRVIGAADGRRSHHHPKRLTLTRACRCVKIWDTRRLAPIARFDVLEDEQLLAWTDQAELAAGDLFDGGGILAQHAGLFAEPCVLRSRGCERLLERPVPRARLHHREQPLVAHQGVNQQHARARKEQILDGAAPLARLGCLRIAC